MADGPRWLEATAPAEPPRGGIGRTLALGLLAVALLVAVVFGVQRWRGGAGDGELIAAPPGPYKVRPDDPGGLEVEGEGETAIATSAGADGSGGRVDLGAVPETPITPERTARADRAAEAVAGRIAVADVPASGGRLIAMPPMTPVRADVRSAAGGGIFVQLGAFPSEAAANAAWAEYARRFGYLAALGKSVQRVEVNGAAGYRLRVDAGSAAQAADLCGRLRVAGEACSVTG